MTEFKRWVEVGEFDGDKIIDYAVCTGISVSELWKRAMCMYFNVILSGTEEQMKATEEAWTKAGIKFERTKPDAASDEKLMEDD